MNKTTTTESKYKFQDDAVKNILADFKKKPNGRLILVIPTGGGKTLTAMKAILEMSRNGLIPSGKKVLWAAHLKSLHSQTVSYRDNKAPALLGCGKELTKLIDVQMKAAAIKSLQNTGDWALIVLDEAHHSAADGYQPFFELGLPILGLTATPTRNDGRDLEFDKVSYSITFAELVRRGVIVPPKFHPISTGHTIHASGLADSEQEKFNTEARNQFLAQEIIKRAHLYKKAIIFCVTVNHVEALYKAIELENSLRKSPFPHVGYIHGGGNERGIDSDDYLKWHKKQTSSILVSCKMLTEGYDDPGIDGVIMACSTDSILFYMQCIGRAVRFSTDKTVNCANVLEFTDHLPNVQYRIDNRWLFAEISDRLEPVVEDIKCSSFDDYKKQLRERLKIYNIQPSQLTEAMENKDFDGTSILCFSGTKDIEKYPWGAICFTDTTRLSRLRVVNYLFDHIDEISTKDINYVLNAIDAPSGDPVWQNNAIKKDLFGACKRAYEEISGKEKCRRLHYFTVRKSEHLPDEFLAFIEGCWNKDNLVENYPDMINSEVVALIKFPLPLGGAEGYWASSNELEFCIKYTASIKEIVARYAPQERESYFRQAEDELHGVPLPVRYLRCFSTLAREGFPEYTYTLAR